MTSRPHQFVLPDLCNATALTLVVLFAQLLVLVLWSASAESTWLQFALLSLFVQWVALTSAGVLCLLRGWLAQLPLVTGALVAFAAVLLIVVIEGLLADRLLTQFSDEPVDWQRLGKMVLVTAILAGLVLRYFYVQQRLRLQEQAELQSRIQALQSRIRPHFLFNSMNIIASLIAVDPDTAETVVEDLSDLFRASLNDAGEQVALSAELDLCERYLRIESLRLGERLQVEWQIEDEVKQVRIPLLTLQPLLENAIYHGVQPRPDGGLVRIEVGMEEEQLVARIENPLPDEANESLKGNHMAMDNIRRRLQALYGDDAALDGEAQDQRYLTVLRFPVSANA